MLLPDALTRLVGAPTLVAMRPSGIMVCLSNRLKVLRFGRNGLCTWVPMFTDLVSIDWQVFSPDQIQAMRQQAAERQATELAKGEGGGGNG